MTANFAIAIDGPGGAGKSSVAKEVSRALGALYLDTGAMYRTVGLAMLRRGIDPKDAAAVAQAVSEVSVGIQYVEGKQRVFLGDEDVSEAIRQPEVSMAASAVSAVAAVRVKLVEEQRQIARKHSVVMDGRDIGTHVLPDAGLKIFLTAAPEERARRRYEELRAKGAQDTYEQVLSDLLRRDHDDSTRAESPLRKADDAVELDTTGLTLEQVIERILTLARQKMGGGIHE